MIFTVTTDHRDDPYEPVEEQPYHEEHEERSSSLAGRLLTYLVLLIAGAALALWGGPKLAPQLPEWAAPAAKYLTPGGDAALKEVTALRDEVDGKLAELSAGPDSAEIREIVAADIQQNVAASSEKLQSEMAALSDQIAAADSGEIEARLAQMESRVEGLSAELAAITETVSSAALEGGSLSEEAMATLTANAGAIQGVRAEIEAIAAQNGTLAQRIDDVEAAAERKVQEAEQELAAAADEAAALAAAKAAQEQLSALQSAIDRGVPFAAELDAVAAAGLGDIPTALSDAAGTGIKSVAILRSELAPLAHDAIRSSIKDTAQTDGGTMSKVTAFFKSQVATRSLEPTEGNSTDAILSRVEAALDGGDLPAVLSEAESLSDAAKSVLSPWLADVSARDAVLNALSTFGASAS